MQMYPVCMYRLLVTKCDLTNVNILDSYKIGECTVHITEDGRYIVQEPHVPDGSDDLYRAIVKKMDLWSTIKEGESGDETVQRFEKLFWETAQRIERIDEAYKRFDNIRYYIRRDLIGYGIVDTMMNDQGIEDILCSDSSKNIIVNHKKYSGKLGAMISNVRFPDQQEMTRFIQKIFGVTGTEPTESRPISVTYMKDGSRISCTFGSQVTKHGPIIAIRKFPNVPLTIRDVIYGNVMSLEAAAYIWTLLDAKAVGLVVGVTGSGKTTLLSSLLTMMNPRWRVITIEDTLELQVPHYDWVRYNTRKSYGMLEEKFDIGIRNLIDSSLTQKPDFEIIGEIRLNDMDMLFQSVGTGHGGLTSFHADGPVSAITRMRGSGIKEGEIALTWFCVHTRVVPRDGQNTRRVGNISEIISDKNTGMVTVDTVYTYDMVSDTLNRGKELADCKRYSTACEILGIMNPMQDMKKRMNLLEECVQTKADTVGKVFAILGRYYT